MPGRRALPSAGEKGQGHGPHPLLVPRRVPLDRPPVDAAVPQALGHAFGKGDRTGAAAAHGTLLGPARDVLALREDRPLETAHLLHRPPRTVRHLLRGQPAADERLDVTGAKAALDLDLELAEARTVTACGSAEGVVEGEAVPAAGGIGEKQVLAVLVDADQAKVLHVGLPSVLVVPSTVPPIPGRIPQPTPER